MPVTPKYTWDQTDAAVTIEVDIPGITKQKADVFGTNALIKVVAHPYFLLVDLAHDVLADKCSAVVKGGSVRFKLLKVSNHAPPPRCHCQWCRFRRVSGTVT